MSCRILLFSVALAVCVLASPTQGKEMYEVWLDFMSGEWTIADPPGGETSYMPLGGTGALRLEGYHPNGFKIHGVIGWCPDFKMFVETVFMSGMARSVREYTVINEKVLRGTYKDWTKQGNSHGTVEYRRIDDNTVELVFTESEADKPSGRLKFMRKTKKE